MNAEEHGAALFSLMRREHEEFLAEVRGWAEAAEEQGRTAAARQHREHVGRLEGMHKPWEGQRAA